MIRNQPTNSSALKELWEVGKRIEEIDDAIAYWKTFNDIMLKVTCQDSPNWEEAEGATFTRLPSQASEQIAFLEQEKKRIQRLPHDAAVRQLIKALKIDAKIAAIRKTASS